MPEFEIDIENGEKPEIGENNHVPEIQEKEPAGSLRKDYPSYEDEPELQQVPTEDEEEKSVDIGTVNTVLDKIKQEEDEEAEREKIINRITGKI